MNYFSFLCSLLFFFYWTSQLNSKVVGENSAFTNALNKDSCQNSITLDSLTSSRLSIGGIKVFTSENLMSKKKYKYKVITDFYSEIEDKYYKCYKFKKDTFIFEDVYNSFIVNTSKSEIKPLGIRVGDSEDRLIKIFGCKSLDNTYRLIMYDYYYIVVITENNKVVKFFTFCA